MNSADDAGGRGRRPAGLSPSQRHALPPFSAIRAFEAVGSCGGIRRAAEALSTDHAAVSRQVRSLESWAGVTLVDRSPGTGGGLTALGRRFHERICGGLAEIAGASMELTRRDDDRRLRLWCAPGLASEWLTKRLSDLADILPLVELELVPSESEPDLAVHEADAYIQYVDTERERSYDDPRVRFVQIALPATEAVASPGYLATLPVPDHAGDLLGMRLLHEGSFEQWRRWLLLHGVSVPATMGGPRLAHNHLTLAAARRGQGVALANLLLIEDDLASGALVKIGMWPPVHLGGYRFVARRDRWRDPVVTTCRRWLETGLRSRSK